MQSLSPLQRSRLKYQPVLPKALQNIKGLSIVKTTYENNANPSEQIRNLFPLTYQFPLVEFTDGPQQVFSTLRVGVVLSGGQAPGGHNVIAGLFDALIQLNPESSLIGFLDGPSGIVKDKTIEITAPLLENYRNQGGFDLIGSGRTKIETEEQFKAAKAAVERHQLDGLVIIGGDDSNTNAALLAEYFLASRCKTSVIGVPKTIDGDLKGSGVEISFGFDTAAKNYSQTIGSLMRDALSAKKYYNFIKLMGRSASHIALECALQTHPNYTLISEEVAAEKKSLKNLVDDICDLICKRALKGKDYGVILIPEGVIEFIPEVRKLIEELNGLLAVTHHHHSTLEQMSDDQERIAYIEKFLSKESLSCFQILPKENRAQLLIGRDAHGNVQVSKIETERMFIEMVKNELHQRSKDGRYKGLFSPLAFFCGYEGRSCLPSNFDCQYCYALGMIGALLINARVTGYICRLKNLSHPAEEWQPGAIPLTSLIKMEKRHGEDKPVIRKALVDLQGKPFKTFKQLRGIWTEKDDYADPGPVQFFGPKELTDSITMTLNLESAAGDNILKIH